MKSFLAPNGRIVYIPEGRVLTYGLTPEENIVVEKALPSKEYELYATSVATDIVAISSGAIIINVGNSEQDAIELFIDYLTEMAGHIEKTVFLIGALAIPKRLEKYVKHYAQFDDIANDLKYLLLSAFKKSKRVNDFSKKLADSILILSLIRSHPGIKSCELSEYLELPIRTIQRHISTLQATGEWIEYDTVKRGWKLQNGISILFGDHMNN